MAGRGQNGRAGRTRCRGRGSYRSGHCPYPGIGGAGVPAESVCLTGRRRGQGMPARSKMVGVWETGEGERVPPPPVAISTRSSAWGEPGEDPGTAAHRLHPGYGFPPAPPQIRFPAGSTPGTAAHLISPRTDPAPGGGGGGAPEARAGWGRPAEEYGYSPCRRRGRGGGRWQRVHGYLYGGAGGVGEAGRGCTGISTEARPGRGRPAEVHGHLPTEARPGRGCRRGIRVSPAEGAAGAGVPARYPGIPLPKARVGCRRRAHRYSPFRDTGRERCPGRQRIGLQSPSLLAASISTRLPAQPARDRR